MITIRTPPTPSPTSRILTFPVMGTPHVLVSPSLWYLGLVLFIFALTAFPTYTAAHQEDKRQALEYCESSAECHADLMCVGVRGKESETGACTKQSHFCLCAPSSTQWNYCESASKCHDGEACGINSNTGSMFCIGCDALLNSTRSYGFADTTYVQCGV